MYLSKLEIVGFKSFAQKVGLTFDNGISAIVGPNGCGKTNIVDAIRWVLGEQRYSALRSDKMEDVIFNGTKARKALGMAEASLVIENTKGILPSEYTQVTVGRRVYRSGESEYLLNKVPCRLKDILDLFMDTGMGADAYSVIELKMIETILSDKTDERRRLFEEAAGVTKYKHRRKAAFRKLESVQADLLRVNDIVAEVQKAVNSLERQAKRAEQFNEVKSRLRTLEVDLMEREYAQLDERTRPLIEKLGTLNEGKARIDADLTQVEAKLDGSRSAMLEIDKRLAEAQRDVSLQMEKIHRVEEKNLVAEERGKAMLATVARLESEDADVRLERDRLVSRMAELTAAIAALQEREAQCARDLGERQAELAECGSRLEGVKEELRALNETTIALVHRIAEGQTEQDRKAGRVENLAGRIEHAEQENAAYEAELLRLDGDIASFSADDRQLRRAFTEAEMKFYDAEGRKKQLKDQLELLHRKDVDVQSAITQQGSRKDFLRSLIESREGLPEGVRHLSASERWHPARKLTVADAVHAEEKFRTAIEAALGEFASSIVVRGEEEARAGILVLKEDDRGKATFVEADRLPRITSRAPLPSVPGVFGWAVDLARYEPEFAPLFRFLLDRVLVVSDATVAAKVSSLLSGVRCVTLEGEVESSVGIVRGGSRRQDEGGTIGKHQQIGELEVAIERLRGEQESITASIAEVSRQHESIELKSFSDGVKAVEKEMNGVEMRIAQLAFEKKRAADIIQKNKEEMETLAAERDEIQREIAAGAPLLEALRGEQAANERNVGAAVQRLQSIEEEWAGQSKAVNDLGIGIATIRGDLQAAINDLRYAEESHRAALDSIEKHRLEIAAAQEDIAATSGLMQEHGTVLAALREELAAVEERRKAVEEESSSARESTHGLELAIKDQRRTHDESLRVAHDVEMKIADLTAKADHIKARALEEFDLRLELKSYPDGEFVDFAALREEIQSLRDRIKSLGNINFAAFEEYTAEKQRFEFLSGQRNDLLEAEKTLLATIEEINTTAQKQFLDTFAQIRTNFIETFKSLFDPGDECDLKLEDEVDPLEARIEIVAKPRGKRPTSIDLLSGGEKTLTATALLFAIYLVKPSPFCILDEVDAPLDDANVDRFTRILRKFSVNTQFIVVTHNKRTMEAANALYGVTMEEEGVSKLVTVRFNQGAEVSSAALASA